MQPFNGPQQSLNTGSNMSGQSVKPVPLDPKGIAVGLPIFLGSGAFTPPVDGVYQVLACGGWGDTYQSYYSDGPGPVAARQVRLKKGFPAFTVLLSSGAASVSFPDGRSMNAPRGWKTPDNEGVPDTIVGGGAATGGDENTVSPGSNVIRGVNCTYVSRPTNNTFGAGLVVVIKIAD